MFNPHDTAAAVGQTVAGFRLDSLLGRGSLGAVYKAFQLSLEREVAVKFLASKVATREEAELLLGEARTAGLLNHPNIVKVYNAGVHEQVPFLVMEFLEGETLHAHLAREGKLAPDVAVSVAVEVAGGLQAAHAKQIIHRDLKPSNVFLPNAGRPKIIDFGLARRTGSRGPNPLHGGTPQYMAPEQWLGRETDARTDLYALGLLLFRMVAGKNAFEGEFQDLREAHLKRLLPIPPDFPDGLAEVVEKCAQKRPEDRYASAADAIAALQGALPEAEEPLDVLVPCPACGTSNPSEWKTCPSCSSPMPRLGDAGPLRLRPKKAPPLRRRPRRR